MDENLVIDSLQTSRFPLRRGKYCLIIVNALVMQ